MGARNPEWEHHMSDTDTGSTSTTDTTTTSTTEDGKTTTATPTVEELQSELEKWKSTSRKHEDRAKANADAKSELDKLRQASMSDTEKAVEAARAETRTATLAEFASKLVNAELKAALKGKAVDAAAVLKSVNHAGFLNSDGDVDETAVTEWAKAFPDEGGTKTTRTLDGGARKTAQAGESMNDLIRRHAGIQAN